MPKKVLLILLSFALLFLSCCTPETKTEISSDTEPETTTATATTDAEEAEKYFKYSEDGEIVSPDNEKYEFLGVETVICAFGEEKMLGRVEGEIESFRHLLMEIYPGMYSCENDPEHRTLVRVVPNNEFSCYYRKSSLPELDISPENCIRFELIKGFPEVEHMTCGDGITDIERCKEFIADVKSQKSSEEADLYQYVRKPDGTFENCYQLGRVYGFFKDEPNLAVPLTVTSYDDKAYSISFGDMEDYREYVLPEKWLSELTAKNH